MAYSKKVYQKAINILQHRRDNALMEQQERTNAAIEKIPQLADIQMKLSRIGYNISTLLFRDENPREKVAQLKEESLKLQNEKRRLLKENGFDEDALAIKYTCSVCNDSGFVNERMCNCHRELLKEIERDNLRRFAPVDDCTFNSFNTEYYPAQAMENGVSPREKAQKILESCRTYAQGFNSHAASILFMGGTGLGKTHLSLAIANVVINKGYSVVYGTAQNILSDLQNESFGRYENLDYTEREVLAADLLIIDDLGTEFKNQFSVACLYNTHIKEKANHYKHKFQL